MKNIDIINEIKEQKIDIKNVIIKIKIKSKNIIIKNIKHRYKKY